MKLFNPCRWIEYGWVKLVDLTSGRGYVGDAVGKTSRLKYLEHSCLLRCNLGGKVVPISCFMTCWLLLAQLFVCYVEIRGCQCHMLCILWPSPLLVRIWQKKRRVMMLTYQLHHNLFIGLLPQAFPNTSDGHFHVFPFFFVYGIIFWQQYVQHEHRPMDIFNMTDGLGVWMQGPLGKSYLYICNVQYIGEESRSVGDFLLILMRWLP